MGPSSQLKTSGRDIGRAVRETMMRDFLLWLLSRAGLLPNVDLWWSCSHFQLKIAYRPDFLWPQLPRFALSLLLPWLHLFLSCKESCFYCPIQWGNSRPLSELLRVISDIKFGQNPSCTWVTEASIVHSDESVTQLLSGTTDVKTQGSSKSFVSLVCSEVRDGTQVHQPSGSPQPPSGTPLRTERGGERKSNWGTYIEYLFGTIQGAVSSLSSCLYYCS